MKKNILGLLVLGAALLLSSCVIVTPENHVEKVIYKYHDFVFDNDTDYTIADWYLRTEAGDKVAKSKDFVRVRPHTSSKMYDVKEDDYRVLFSLAGDPYQYYYSDLFTLNEDKFYYLTTYYVIKRSAVNGEEIKETKLCLTDQDGNKIELKSERIE